MPRAWKDRKRPTMRGTSRLPRSSSRSPNSRTQAQSDKVYLARRSSGIGASLWPAAVTLARVLSVLSFAAVANERGDQNKVATLIGEARATLGDALTMMREPLADSIAERLRIAGGGDVWGADATDA